MKKVMKIMDRTGDSRVEFECGEAIKSKAETEAQELFERLTAKGAAVFAVNRPNGQEDKRVKNFSELEEENIVVPRIVAG